AAGLAWLAGRPPVEPERLSRTLPFAPASHLRANTAYLVWRAVVPTALGAAPLYATPGVLITAAMAAGLAVVVGLAVLRSYARRDPPPGLPRARILRGGADIKRNP